MHTTLTLTRPLIWLDVETHDKCPPARAHICELSFTMYYPDGRTKSWSSLIQPGRPITDGAKEVHGISNDDVTESPTFAQLARNLAANWVDCDFGGYNVRFDLQVLVVEMERAGVPWSYEGAFIFDPLRLWQVLQPRTLGHAVKHWCNRESTEAHRASGDVQDVIDVALAMLGKHPELPRTLQGLHELCYKDSARVDPDAKFIWANGEVVVNFGKWAGTPLKQVNRGYLEWMVRGEFSPEAKKIATEALNGTYPIRT